MRVSFCECLDSQQCRVAYKWDGPITRSFRSTSRFRITENNESKGTPKNECVQFKWEGGGMGCNVSCGAFLCHKLWNWVVLMRVLQDAGEEASEQGAVRWKAIMNEIIRPLYAASFIFLSPMDVREQQVWLTSNTNCADDIALSVFTGMTRDSAISVSDIYGSWNCIVW